MRDRQVYSTEKIRANSTRGLSANVRGAHKLSRGGRNSSTYITSVAGKPVQACIVGAQFFTCNFVKTTYTMPINSLKIFIL